MSMRKKLEFRPHGHYTSPHHASTGREGVTGCFPGTGSHTFHTGPNPTHWPAGAKRVFHSARHGTHFPVDGHHVFYTEGPGSWMNVPQTPQASKVQRAPTDAHPFRQQQMLRVPYKR